jgi:hypothetical protein
MTLLDTDQGFPKIFATGKAGFGEQHCVFGRTSTSCR